MDKFRSSSDGRSRTFWVNDLGTYIPVCSAGCSRSWPRTGRRVTFERLPNKEPRVPVFLWLTYDLRVPMVELRMTLVFTFEPRRSESLAKRLEVWKRLDCDFTDESCWVPETMVSVEK